GFRERTDYFFRNRNRLPEKEEYREVSSGNGDFSGLLLVKFYLRFFSVWLVFAW
ncbi:hypothetical protein PanWU01x14_041770, partial [Parasponia andersonii]